MKKGRNSEMFLTRINFKLPSMHNECHVERFERVSNQIKRRRRRKQRQTRKNEKKRCEALRTYCSSCLEELSCLHNLCNVHVDGERSAFATKCKNVKFLHVWSPITANSYDAKFMLAVIDSVWWLEPLDEQMLQLIASTINFMMTSSVQVIACQLGRHLNLFQRNRSHAFLDSASEERRNEDGKTSHFVLKCHHVLPSLFFSLQRSRHQLASDENKLTQKSSD